jgi:hypothetical protein
MTSPSDEQTVDEGGRTLFPGISSRVRASGRPRRWAEPPPTNEGDANGTATDADGSGTSPDPDQL